MLGARRGEIPAASAGMTDLISCEYDGLMLRGYDGAYFARVDGKNAWVVGPLGVGGARGCGRRGRCLVRGAAGYPRRARV